jgi:hypothetical protein
MLIFVMDGSEPSSYLNMAVFTDYQYLIHCGCRDLNVIVVNVMSASSCRI